MSTEEKLNSQEEETVKNQETENIAQPQEQQEQAEETAQTEEAQPEASQEKELTAEEKLAKELEEAQKQIEEMKDKYLRLSAEFDNYRKRTLKEKAELIKNGAEKTMGAILPVLDDLERALQNMQKSDDVQAIYEGVDLTMQIGRAHV